MAKLISPEELYERLQASGSEAKAQELTVVDVRSAEAYAKGHIPGAIHIERDELPRRSGEIPTDRPVVTY